jgi:hypothetical protein
MRVFFWGLVIVAVGYAAYSGMIAAWSWIAVQNAVDEVISREGAAAMPPQEIKTRVIQSTAEAGVSLTEREISVTDAGDGVRIEVTWTMPVIVVKGEPVLQVPLSVTRATGR